MQTDATMGGGSAENPVGAARGRDCFRRSFRAEPYAVREALRAALARFVRRLTPEDAGALELALAEVLNNVVEHGYGGMEPGTVEMVLCHAGGSFHCRIEDCGQPMPGRALPLGRLPATDVDRADLAEGGWGWALIRDLTADLSYARDDGGNRLCFRIPLAGS